MTNVLELSQAAHAHPGQAEFWRQEIAGHGPPTKLPRDYLRQDPRRPVGTCSAPVDAETTQAVGRFTHDDPALVRIFHASVLAVLAARATDTSRVSVVLPVSGQAIAVAVDVDRRASFRSLVAGTRAAVQRASANLDVPVGHLFSQVQSSQTDVALVIDGDISPADTELFGCVLRFDVSARVELSHRSDLFTSSTALGLVETYAGLLATVARNPHVLLADLLDASPQDHVRIARFNDTAADFPDDVPLHRFLERRAAETPDRIAVAGDGLTYGEVNRRANQLARRLRDLGVRQGDVVGVCLKRGAQVFIAVHAVLKAGAAYLPIDPSLPDARIAHMIANSDVAVVVGATPTPGVTFVDIDAVAPDADESDVDGGAGPDDACYVIYTSGSTGRPKGVVVEHRAIVNRIAWMQQAYPVGPDDVILHKTPFTFDVSVWELFWWAVAGAAVCTLSSGDERDPQRIVNRIAECAVTTVHFVPSMLQAFLRYVDATASVDALGSLRRVFASGEALATAHVESFRRLLGGTSLVNLYGPTEAAVDVTHFDCAEADSRRPVPIGRPIANVQLQIRNRANAVAPIGTPGELYIAGTGLARGYHGAAELTAKAFVPDPADPGRRSYRTGDLARWLPDGTVEFLGRADNQVKIRGYRIEPGEIEHVAKLDPAVDDCAVTVVAGSLCAYVVAKAGFDEQRVAALFEAELPSYMVPAFVVTVARIPVGPNGKRDVTQLPPPARPDEYVAPRTPEERSLAGIWAHALGRDRVGIRDNFFELGGDSITFIGVLAAARTAGFGFSFQDLFAYPTVEQLAGRRGTGADASVRTEPFALLDQADRERLPADAVDAYPLSALQTGLLYETSRLGKGLYHDVASYRVHTTLQLDAFRAAVKAVVAHHPILRTSFHIDGYSEPIQVVHSHVTNPLVIEDGVSPAELDRAVARYHETELATGFQPGETDLVRFRLHVAGERAYYSVSYHAAALDGWSVSVIHRDLFTAYFAILRNETPVFPQHDVSFADFVVLERAALDSAGQQAFWPERLRGTQSTQIPRSPRPVNVPSGVVMHDVPVSPEMSAAILRTAATLRVPVKTLLLAAHIAVLSVVSGSQDVLTGYEHSGRPEEHGGEHLAGLFLNTVPLRLPVPDGSWAELVRSVYDAETDLLPHRRFPLPAVKHALGERERLFETVFNFTHFHALKGLGFDLARSAISSRTEFPFRAEFWQDAFTDEVGLSLHYDPAEFGTGQIGRIAGYYLRALDLLTTRTTEDHRAHSLLSPQELTMLTEQFAGPVRPLPPGTVLDLFAEQVRQRPTAIALVAEGKQLDYQMLDRESDRLASFLSARGVGHGDVVAMPMDRGLSWAAGVLALLKLGAVYLPQDPADPPARLDAMIRRSRCRHVLTSAVLADELRGLSAQVLVSEDAEPGPMPARRPHPEDVAYIIFTSGSTGEPKGAMIRHLGMLNHLQAKIEDLGLGPDDRVAQTATQCFDISVWQLLVAWLVGGRTMIYGREIVTDPPALLDALTDDEVTIAEVVPSHLDALLTELEHRPRPLPALRYNLVTGETFPPSLTSRWFARCEVPLVNAYGPTEASDDVTHHVVREPVDGGRVPVGTPVLNTRLYIVAKDGRLAPLGTYGEVCVTGPGVGLGYVNDPARTSIAFRPNEFDDTSPLMYRTGDVGRWLPSGVLDCAGRVDQQVKIRGHRIELSEIEGALASLAGIEHAVVLVRQSTLVAYCTGSDVGETAGVRAALAERLPHYMLPDFVVPCATFPLNSNGKVDRAQLLQRQLPQAEQHREPPAGAAETRLRDVFAEVLGLRADSVGVTDNFFELGGHSLAAMRLASKLGGTAGIRDVLDHPTVRSLAARIASNHRELLVDLTAAAGLDTADPVATLVCVPAAGGSAVSYLPLATAMHAPIRVLAVELPGRTATDPRPLVPVEQLATELAAEIVAGIPAGPVVLLGHSAGAGLALATALVLERLGRPIAHLVIAGNVLTSLNPDDYAADEEPLSDEDIVRWISETAGAANVTRLDTKDLVGAFRHDSVQARRAYQKALRERQERVLRCPVTVVLARDDLVTAGQEKQAWRWGVLGAEVDVVFAETGGHHLNITRPEFLAARVRAGLGRGTE